MNVSYSSSDTFRGLRFGTAKLVFSFRSKVLLFGMAFCPSRHSEGLMGSHSTEESSLNAAYYQWRNGVQEFCQQMRKELESILLDEPDRAPCDEHETNTPKVNTPKVKNPSSDSLGDGSAIQRLQQARKQLAELSRKAENELADSVSEI